MSDQNYKEVKFSDYFIITAIAIFLSLYYSLPDFHQFIDFNLDYIFTHYDVLIFFAIVFIIPISIYILSLILRIIRKFWTSYSFLKIRILLSIIRFNFCLFAYITMPFAILTRWGFGYWGTWGFGIIIVMILNRFFIVYDEMTETQVRNENLRENKEKEEILIHPILLVIYPVLFIFLMIYLFGDPIIKQTIDTFWIETIASDFLFNLIFWLTMVLSIFWWFVAFLIVIFLGALEKYREKMLVWMKVLLFCALIYLIAKVLIFNLTATMVEPGTTLVSLGVSGGSGLILKVAKNKMFKINKEE